MRARDVSLTYSRPASYVRKGQSGVFVCPSLNVNPDVAVISSIGHCLNGAGCTLVGRRCGYQFHLHRLMVRAQADGMCINALPRPDTMAILTYLNAQPLNSQ